MHVYMYIYIRIYIIYILFIIYYNNYILYIYKEEVFNQTHTPTSFDRSYAFCETSSANLSSEFLHRFMECVQLRLDDFASVINLSDYPLTVPQRRVLSRGLKFTPLLHSVDRLSLRESIAKFERSLRLAYFFHDKN